MRSEALAAKNACGSQLALAWPFALDTPELFWSEASLLPLYEAIRDYLEITARVQLLNERLSVSGELLEIVHDYIGEGQMEHITMIIIWLIGESPAGETLVEDWQRGIKSGR